MTPTEADETRSAKSKQQRAASSPEAEGILIRRFEVQDTARCQELAESNYDFSHVLDLQASHILVAEAHRQTVGFGYIHVWHWNKVGWLSDFIVGDAWRGRGIGRKLVLSLAEAAKNEGCLILMDHPPTNHPVIGFYLKLGFRFCGYNDSYFSNPKNRMAVFLGLDL